MNGEDAYAHPNRFFIASQLAASAHGAASRARSFPFDIWYGYHFDAVLLGAIPAQEGGGARREVHEPATWRDAKLKEHGDIASVVTTKEGETIEADFFVDCTGFAGAADPEGARRRPFVSFSEQPLQRRRRRDAHADRRVRSRRQTISTAMKHGWTWKIPLTNRYGNGYVYSSAFCSADEAERELREMHRACSTPTHRRAT